MTQVVVKLAQPGFDVETAGDENLIYSSKWPLLKIVAQGTFSIDTLTQQTTVYTHNLGYPPAFWIFSNQQEIAWVEQASITKNQRAEFLGTAGALLLFMDSNKLYLLPSVDPLDHAISFTWYIFALDLSKNFIAPTIKTGGAGGGNSREVFKLAKKGKDISSHNLEDFVVHSKARSPLIHSVSVGLVQENLGGGLFSFTAHHNLGYIPMFFTYLSADGIVYNLTGTGGTGTSKFLANEQIVQRQDAGASNNQYTIIILKDPFSVDYSVAVSV